MRVQTINHDAAAVFRRCQLAGVQRVLNGVLNQTQTSDGAVKPCPIITAAMRNAFMREPERQQQR